MAYYVAENWRLVQQQAVSQSTILIKLQAVYVVIKLPLGPKLCTYRYPICGLAVNCFKRFFAFYSNTIYQNFT